MTQRWKNRPAGSNWGEFGPDDERGRLNLITPEKVRQGLAEAREGLTFCLSLPLDYPGGSVLSAARHPPRLMASLRNGRPYYNYPYGLDDEQLSDVLCDDAVLLYTQYSTQWDALSHVGSLFDADGDGVAEPVYYNGFRAGLDVVGPETAPTGTGAAPPVAPTCARRLGIEKMATTCVQGRAVMIDLHGIFGAARRLIGYDGLMRACDAGGVTVERGDMVCLHTGFAQLLLDMHGTPDPDRVAAAGAVLDGRDAHLLHWIDDSGLAALIADNFAVEAFPGRTAEGHHAALPLHELCLFKLGIHLGELWYLSALNDWLRAHARYRFLLTAPPLRLPGAVGSPVTPVATV